MTVDYERFRRSLASWAEQYERDNGMAPNKIRWHGRTYRYPEQVDSCIEAMNRYGEGERMSKMHAAAQQIKEAPVGAWAWLGLAVLVFVYVLVWDLWLGRNQYETMTAEFKEGLLHPLWGPVLWFLTAGAVAAFVAHMWHSGD